MDVHLLLEIRVLPVALHDEPVICRRLDTRKGESAVAIRRDLVDLLILMSANRSQNYGSVGQGRAGL